MKKTNYIFTLLVTVLAGLSLAGCKDGDDLDTNQYLGGNSASLNVWGPNPVMYGGTIMFKGSNLDQVSQIILPGCDPITNIEVVQAGTPSEIRISVPDEAFGSDYVKLITNTDKEIVTKTQIEFEQGIEFEAFSPASIMPGDVLTITGEYLQLVECIEFAEGVYVSKDDFIAHDRNEIQVTVPDNARTGEVSLLDLDLTKMTEEDIANATYNSIPSEDALEVGTPTVTALSTPRGEAEPQGTVTAKVGETITITGEYMKLVGAVKFGDVDSELGESETTEFTVNDEGTTLTLTLPADAPDGDINLVCLSGVEIPVGVLVTVAPTDCVAAPSPVKAGGQLTITGNDMDVVTAVEMPNVTDAIEITVSATSVVIAAVPETAQEGNLVLRMANGKGVEVPFTLVKPEVTGYDNATVSAGGALTILGTNLDLVKSVQFGEGSDLVEVEPVADGTSITLTVPMNAVSGAPTLNLANGTSVQGKELTVNEAVFCYATQLPGEDEELKAGAVLTLPVANIDKLTGVQIDGIDCQYIQSDNTLYIGIPTSAGSGSKVRLVSSNGEVSYTIDFIPATEVSKTVWSGMTELTWGAGGRVVIPASAFENVPAGAIMTLCYTQKDGIWGQAQVNYADWGGINFTEGDVKFSQTLVPTDVYGWFSDGVLNRETPVVLTQDILNNILAKRDDISDESATDCGVVIQGEHIIFTKVTISYTQSLEQNISNCLYREDRSGIMPLPLALSWGDDGRFRILIDKEPSIKDMNLKAGESVMYFYTTGTGKIQINDGNWSKWIEEENADAKVMELVLTQDMVDWLKGTKSDGWSSTGMIIQGEGMTINKVTILP